ncbi:MAG: leucine-rich repeat domain-containing protein [Candidatus Pacebacteria bacterium]|nr:leucine-rich repeat domain-containing protein [Candidatus Paceibacterota bacterium]
MEVKNILLVLIIISVISVVFLFVKQEMLEYSIEKKADQPMTVREEKKLCNNDNYSTIEYSSLYISESTVQLSEESKTRLKEAIDKNSGSIPAGSFDGLGCLEEVDITYTSLGNISELSRLDNLKVLNLQSNNIYDLSPLSNMKRLRILNLNENFGISNLSPLSKMTTLEKLYLSYANVTDISPLSGLVNLNELGLSWTKVKDVSPLKPLINLKTLYTRNVPILSENLKTLRDNTDLVIIKH